MLIEEYGKIITVYSKYGNKVWTRYEDISMEILRDVCLTFHVELKEMGQVLCEYQVYWASMAYTVVERPGNSSFSILNKTDFYKIVLTKANSLWPKNDNS